MLRHGNVAGVLLLLDAGKVLVVLIGSSKTDGRRVAVTPGKRGVTRACSSAEVGPHALRSQRILMVEIGCAVGRTIPELLSFPVDPALNTGVVG